MIISERLWPAGDRLAVLGQHALRAVNGGAVLQHAKVPLADR